MRLINFARQKAFWLLDSLKGKTVRKAYMEIKYIDTINSNEKFLLDYKKRMWRALQEHACKTTIFYKPYVNSKFSEFPIINKNNLKEHLEQFLSDNYVKEQLFKMSTSGSTGTPFVCYQNEYKKRRVNAEIIYYSEKAGYQLGNNLSYIRTVVKQNRKSKFQQFLQNQTLIQCEKLDDAGIEKMISQIVGISKKEPVTLLAYASTYTAIKDYADRKSYDKIENCNMNGIISGSEMLYDSTRNAMKKLFDAEVVSRYSNEENGVIGQDEGKNNVFTINEADYLVEIVDEDGNAVPDGVTGRIIITDLYNYAMPLIRYDTGDMGAVTLVAINGREKRVITNFSGRKVDVIYDTKGHLLSPHVITNQMWSFPDIRQFQFIQKGKKEYLIRLNAKIDMGRRQALVADMQHLLGEDARIMIEEVDEIPVLASGKRRYIVNEWRN